MYTNAHFALTDEQLAKLTEWSRMQHQADYAEDCQESVELSVTFSFSKWGRDVVASVNPASNPLVLEDCLEDWLSDSKPATDQPEKGV